MFATADTGDKGRFLGARHDLLDLRRADHRSARARPRGRLQRRRGRVARGARYGCPERRADPDVLVDAAVGEREVRPRRGEAPRVHRTSAQTSRSTTRRPIGYDCDYADDVLYKAFSAQLEEKGSRRVRVPSASSGRRKTRTASHSRSRKARSPRRPRRNGWTRTRTSGKPGCRRPDRAFEVDAGRPSGAAPAFGGADVSEHVRMWIGGAWVDAEDGATFDATSPSTGEVIGTVPEGTRADAAGRSRPRRRRGRGGPASRRSSVRRP